VGDRLKEFRQIRGLTAGGLAERCAQIGAPEITRSVIANIETGRRGPDGRRRREISVDEVLVFAYALQVPPLALVAPRDGSEQLQVTPDVVVGALDASAWLTGEDLPADFYGTGGPPPRQVPLAFPVLRRIAAALDRAEMVKKVNTEYPAEGAVALANIAAEIADLNDLLASLGFAPLELPPDMAALVQRAAIAPGESG
jgi:transcriptional regulator with XRE-family HTH domain